MPDPAERAVEVSQADSMEAKRLALSLFNDNFDPEAIRETFEQAFARHRIAHTIPAPRCDHAQLIDGLRTHAYDDCGGVELPTHICNIAADYIAHTPQASDDYERGLEDAAKEMIGDLEMAGALIQEAKGFEGEQGGPITNHLDFAEHWINKTISTLALKGGAK